MEVSVINTISDGQYELPVFFLEDINRGLELALDNFCRLFSLALSERFADTEDDGESSVKSNSCLVCNECRRFSKDGSAFRVT